MSYQYCNHSYNLVQRGPLVPISELVDNYSTNRMFKKKSVYDYKHQIDEMKSNLLTPWQKVVKKVTWQPESYDYYNNLPIKPGVFIYKALIESKYPLKQLKINIPETLCVFNGLSWITTNQNGKLEARQNDFIPRNFYDKVREIAENAYESKHIDPQHPAAIDRKWGVHSWDKFIDSINYGPDTDSIFQQFIYTGQSKASTVRLFYSNPHAQQGQQQTFAYYLQNKLTYDHPKSRIEEKCAICSSKENSFDHFVMKGQVLEQYEYYAEQLCLFLFKSYGLRIEQIALDFIKDEREVIYFLDVNGFKILEYQKISRLSLLNEDQLYMIHQEAKDIQDKANNTVQCQLCRLSYKKSEVTKIVTFKMLYELKNHLYKRGIFKFDYLDKISESTLSCKVCDICYMLVVAEHELIEVEKLYAISQNIPLEEKKKSANELKKVNSENIRQKLSQWRLLFYFQEFQDIQLSALKEKSTTGKLYLMMKLFDFYTVLEVDNILLSVLEAQSPTKRYDGMSSDSRKKSLARAGSAPIIEMKKTLNRRATLGFLHSTSTKEHFTSNFAAYPKQQQILLKKLRTHFFFVDDLENLEFFIKNTEVEFRITDGPKWNRPLAFASAYPFTHFDIFQSSKGGEYVQRQNILLHFFGNDIDPFYLLTATGLKKDKEIKTEKITLYKYNNLYFPDNTYYNSDPLPIEWLELFESREFFLSEFKKEEDETKNLGFTPFCSKKELNYLEHDFKGRWNVRQEAIISGLGDTRQLVEACTERLYPKSLSSRSLNRSARGVGESSLLSGERDKAFTNVALNNATQKYAINEPIKEFQFNEDLNEESGDEDQETSTHQIKNKRPQQKQEKELLPLSKEKLKLQLDSLQHQLKHVKSISNLENNMNSLNLQKYDFQIKTQVFNMAKNYAETYIPNSKSGLLRPSSSTRKLKGNQQIQIQNEKKKLKGNMRQRPFSATQSAYNLMSTIGDQNQYNQQSETSLKFEIEPSTNIMNIISHQNTIKEEDEDNRELNRDDFQTQPKMRPQSNYTNANNPRAQRSKNRKIALDNFNTVDSNKDRQMKRPASAANFLTHNQRFQSSLTQQQSVKHVFSIYDRPPSGIMNILKKDKKSKKKIKKIKLKGGTHGIQSPDSLSQQTAGIPIMITSDGQPQYAILTPVDSMMSLQYSQTSSKLIADHRMGSLLTGKPLYFKALQSDQSTQPSQYKNTLSQASRPNQFFGEILHGNSGGQGLDYGTGQAALNSNVQVLDVQDSSALNKFMPEQNQDQSQHQQNQQRTSLEQTPPNIQIDGTIQSNSNASKVPSSAIQTDQKLEDDRESSSVNKNNELLSKKTSQAIVMTEGGKSEKSNLEEINSQRHYQQTEVKERTGGNEDFLFNNVMKTQGST